MTYETLIAKAKQQWLDQLSLEELEAQGIADKTTHDTWFDRFKTKV